MSVFFKKDCGNVFKEFDKLLRRVSRDFPLTRFRYVTSILSDCVITFTARQRSYGKLMFSVVCVLSFYLSTGGGCPPMTIISYFPNGRYTTYFKPSGCIKNRLCPIM